MATKKKGSGVKSPAEKHLQRFKEKTALLASEALQVPSMEDNINIVFLSVCDGIHRAAVSHGTGATVAEAWARATEQAKKTFTALKMSPKWIKADVVTQKIPVDSELLEKVIGDYRPFFLRKGIAFDENFKTAFLESELNCNRIIDYTNKNIDLPALNRYLRKFDQSPVRSIPQRLIFFSCRGFICDDDNTVHPLYEDELNYGRRAVETDYDYVKSAVCNSSQFLIKSVLDNGQFIYGYFPIFNNTINHYNILRHAGAIWSLINYYKLTGDETVLSVIHKTVNFLVNEHVVYKDEDTAFVLEKFSNEIKLGGNGIATVVLIEYMNTFEDFQYTDLCRKLGNGILHLQSLSDKAYYHVLNYPDFIPKEETRVVYYDGEATFALCKLHALTKDEKWLTAAGAAIDFFIEHHYEKYVDHWIAYAVSEYTLHIPQEKYFAFALHNIQSNLAKIYNQQTTYHTYAELLMAGFLLYDRLKTNKIPCDYLENVFDEKAFLETIYKRMDYMLNGYLSSEYAMYLGSPSTILNTFCVRHQGYRVRIDDVQHFLGGYFLFLFEYDKLKVYRDALKKQEPKS